MTESPTESAPEIVEEPKAPPVPEISPSSTDEPTSAASREAELLADALARIEVLEASKRTDEDLSTLIERGIQSTKDVRFQDLETLRKFKKYLDKHEGDEEAAIKDMELDSMLAERRASTKVPGRTEVGVPRGDPLEYQTAERLKRAREKYGVEVSDEKVQELANSKRYYDNDEWLEDLDELIIKEAKAGSVTPAAAVGSGGGHVLPQSSKEVLQQQYDEEQKQIQSGKHPTIKRGNVQGIQEMKQKYKKQGLDIT